MPRRVLTQRDIEDLAAAGTTQIELDADTLVTALARDRARELGVRLLPATGARPTAPATATDLHARVRAAVIARLGGTPEGLDAIISRVLEGKQGG
ncbi:MAG: hypothetical protein RMN24_03790 [Anaerolineae bacterium]|nr:hypothetical protein [Caldilineales bacterium]MCX7852503.1 hypothetical protein [Caldilineales bacterium]MDW8268267.1 hypothetical protein [Anaerolineae bacterium]